MARQKAKTEEFLENRIWKTANKPRKKMDATEY